MRDVVLYLEPGATVEGRVADRNGDPIANAKIFVGKSSVLAHSTRYGAFTLDSLPPGPATISASHGNYTRGSASANLVSNGVTPVETMLSHGGQVEGVVTHGGVPVSDRDVTIYFPPPGGRRFETKNDANGAYHFAGLPEGEATLTAVLFGGNIRNTLIRYRSVRVFVQNERTTAADIDFPPIDAPAMIEGVVYLDENTPLQAHLRASIRSTDGNETVSSSTDADSDGSFLFDGLPAGSVVLRAEFPGYPKRVLTFDIQEGERIRRDIDFGGGANATITVTVANLPSDAGRPRIIAFHGVVDIPDREPDKGHILHEIGNRSVASERD